MGGGSFWSLHVGRMSWLGPRLASGSLFVARCKCFPCSLLRSRGQAKAPHFFAHCQEGSSFIPQQRHPGHSRRGPATFTLIGNLHNGNSNLCQSWTYLPPCYQVFIVHPVTTYQPLPFGSMAVLLPRGYLLKHPVSPLHQYLRYFCLYLHEPTPIPIKFEVTWAGKPSLPRSIL